MTVSYELVKANDRLFFHDGEQYVLFDSGYICNPFGKNSVSVTEMIGPFRARKVSHEDITKFINMQVNGCDVTAVFNPMDGYNCLLKGDQLTISEEKIAADGKMFFPFVNSPLPLMVQLPIIDGSINGSKCRFFFDSGARMTMFGDRSDAASEKIRSYTEWMAQGGYYKDLDVFKVRLGFPNGFEYEGEGALVTDTAYLKQGQIMGIKAMLGIDVFNHYDMAVITQGTRRGVMLLDK